MRRRQHGVCELSGQRAEIARKAATTTMRLLCTPPIAEHWSAELAALDATVTTLEFDGTVPGDVGANWDPDDHPKRAYRYLKHTGRSWT